MNNKFYIECRQDLSEMTELEIEKFVSYVERSLMFNHVIFITSKDGKGTYDVRFIAYMTAKGHTWAKIKSNFIHWIFERKVIRICKKCGIECY